MRNLKHKPSPRRGRKNHHYKAKVLPFRTPLNGISESALRDHHDRLYVGYVGKKNEVENRLEQLGHEIIAGRIPGGNAVYSEFGALKQNEPYVANGVYLHELYFDALGGDGSFDDAPELVNALSQTYGSMPAFIKYFTECAMAARAWTVLAWDTREERLWIYNCNAHDQGGVWGVLPVIVLDVSEHAYLADFGSGKHQYIEAFWKNVNWSAPNERFKRASQVREVDRPSSGHGAA